MAVWWIKACLHVPSPRPCPSKSPAKFIIVPMVTDRLRDRLDSEPILSVNVNLMVTLADTGWRRVSGPSAGNIDY